MVEANKGDRMFIKTNNQNCWINLSTCRQIDVIQKSKSSYRIELRSAIVGSGIKSVFCVGNFGTEGAAREALNSIWQAHRDGESTWPLWDDSAIERINNAWDKVKTDNPSMDLIKNAKLSVNGLYEVTIMYSSGGDQNHHSEHRGVVEAELKKVFIVPEFINIKWVPCDQLR